MEKRFPGEMLREVSFNWSVTFKQRINDDNENSNSFLDDVINVVDKASDH